MQQKISPQTTENVMEIMRLALEINPVPTRQGKTENDPSVLARFSGHCCRFCVDIYPQGWSSSTDRDLNCYEVWLNESDAEDETAKIIAALKELQGRTIHAK